MSISWVRIVLRIHGGPGYFSAHGEAGSAFSSSAEVFFRAVEINASAICKGRENV